MMAASFSRCNRRFRRLPSPKDGVFATKFAAVVVFDPRTIADEATFASPGLPTKGIEHVFVNGEAIFRDGKPQQSESERMPGRFLRFGG